jgi:transposase
MTGIGKIAAASIITNLPILGYINSKQASSLIGVAPINRESRLFKGHQKIQGGRPQVRTVLYMAIIVCIRKIIVILNSMLRDGVSWEAPKVIN